MILNAFIFGVLSYAILAFVYWTWGSTLHILDIDVNSTKLLDQKLFIDIFFAMAIAILVGVASLYIETYKVVTRIVQRLGATKEFGDEDVWDFVFNSSAPSVNIVPVQTRTASGLCWLCRFVF